MLTLIAVDEDRMVATVEDGHECSGDLVRRDRDEGFLVARDAELEEGDAVAVEKARVGFGVLFEDECENGSQAERTEEWKVFLFGEAGSVDVRVDHGKVVRWEEILLKIWRGVVGRSFAVIGKGNAGQSGRKGAGCRRGCANAGRRSG